MSNCAIKFGVGNFVEDSTLVGVPEPVTNINWLKNADRSKKVRFTDLSSDTLSIEGTLDAQQWAGFFAIPGSNLTAGAEIKLELFETDVSTTDLLDMGFVQLGSMIPLGVWRAGIDPYGAADEQSNIYAQWFDSPIQFQRFKLSIKHDYTIDPSPPLTGELLQDDTTGIFCAELESVTPIDNGGADSWAVTADATASGGSCMTKSGPTFFWNHIDGPKLPLTFQATISGAHNLYLRVNVASMVNSVYTVFDGHSVTNIIPIGYVGWQWVKARSVTLVAGQVHSLQLAARDYGFVVDKIVIQPTTTAAPTGTGPAISVRGAETAGEKVDLRMLIIGQAIQLEKSMSYGNEMQFMTAPKMAYTYSGFGVETEAAKEVRTFDFDLDAMTKADKIQMVELKRALAGRPVMVSAYPGRDEWTEKNYTMLAKFINPASHIDAGVNDYTAHQTMVEV